MRPQTFQCRYLQLRPLGRLLGGTKPSVCHLERGNHASTLLLSASQTTTVTHSVAAPARLQWAARSRCPHTRLKRTDCLRPHPLPLLLQSPARPPQRSRLHLRLPLVPPVLILPQMGRIKNGQQTALPPLSSLLPLPGLPPSSPRPSRPPPCHHPRPL